MDSKNHRIISDPSEVGGGIEAMLLEVSELIKISPSRDMLASINIQSSVRNSNFEVFFSIPGTSKVAIAHSSLGGRSRGRAEES